MPTIAPRVKLKPNIDKILASISYIIATGDRLRKNVGLYDIVKTLFIADRSHLNQFGRPITFDNYVAMRAGPVPSLAYDILKEKKEVLNRFHLSTVPWRRREIGHGVVEFYCPNLTTVDELLSDSDKSALSSAFDIIKSLTYQQIIDLTHNDPAYREAWDPESEKKSFSMSLGMLFDLPNFQEAEGIAFLSKTT